MSGARTRSAGATVLICLALSLSATASDALSQEPGSKASPATAEPVQADQQQMVAPTPTPLPSEPETGAEAAPGPAVQPPEPEPHEAGDNAAALPWTVKRQEAEQGCTVARPRVSPMLAVGGSVGADVDDSWALLAFLIALGAGAIASLAFVVRRRRSAVPRERNVLELAGTVVAIASGMAGLLVQFVPGIGVRERPVPEAGMTVKDVHPRITRGEFSRALELEPPRSRLDRREVGNVVWLELRLAGYGGKALRLQWGAYDPDQGNVLLPETAREMALRVEQDSDVQTRFQPVWVGHPDTRRFRVEFRLLDGPEVREMASTGVMPALTYRYSCPGG